MKYAIFYFSPCGGTKTVADIISRELGDAPMQELTTPSMNTAIDRDTLTFFCIPVYGGRIPKPMYDRMKIITGDKTPCVPVAVFGNRAVDDALLEMSELAAKCGFVTVAGCEIVAPHSIDPEFGAGRPDAADKAKIHEFIEKLKSMDSFSPVKMPGDPGYAKKKSAALPLYPRSIEGVHRLRHLRKVLSGGSNKGQAHEDRADKVYKLHEMRCNVLDRVAQGAGSHAPGRSPHAQKALLRA